MMQEKIEEILKHDQMIVLQWMVLKKTKSATSRQMHEEFDGMQFEYEEDKYEEYGVIKLTFETTEKKLEELRDRYQISDDVTLRLLRGNEMANNLSDGKIMVYMKMFKLGFRLPIEPYFARMLVRLV